MSLKELREASYNPRIISQKRLDNLHKSMTTYGDLSGVVFNVKTGVLVSGHQRLKPFRSKDVKTKIVKKKVKDEFGTVAEGHIEVKTGSGTLRIPYREVSWSDKRAEIAANIAANAHGGDFDRTKLGVLLEKLESGKKFDIDVLGLDPLSIRSLMPKTPPSEDKDDDEDGIEFQEFDENSFAFEHTCPKCKFQYNTSAKPAKKVVKEPKAEKKEKPVKKKDKPQKKVKSDKPKK